LIRPGSLRLRVVAVHEALHQEAVGALGGVERPLDLVGVARQRLLAEHVLAGFERPDRPLDVERVGERDVHGLDVLVRKQSLVAAVGALDPALPRVRLSAAAIAAGDRGNVDAVGEPGAGQDSVVDPSRGEEAPRDPRR
jgi:hypothetical protein